jgi:phosphate starvation-inducible protein PhoH and related proteins
MQENDKLRQHKIFPEDNKRLTTLCGPLNKNLTIMEHYLGLEINNRGFDFQLFGKPSSIPVAIDVIDRLYKMTATKNNLDKADVLLTIKSCSGESESNKEIPHKIVLLCNKTIKIKARSHNQAHYLDSIDKFDINFGIGPSGTGKTYLAVAQAVKCLEEDQVNRIILVRPAVEAGEKLGFLPGDLAQKVDPYLRPLYDALYEMLGNDKAEKYIEQGIIEVAPLAYMRGRTLNDAFVILDESQNTTPQQMKMLLTRIGFGSKAVITGDITQTDLPRHITSGLRHAINILKDVEGICFTFLKAQDVVRHPLVQRIVCAYEEATQAEPA